MSTVYVSGAEGSDRHGSGAKSDPFRTIGRALDEKLGAGDTVVVGSGVYDESVVVAKWGNAKSYFTLRSEVEGGAVIDASDHLDTSGIQIYGDFVRVWGFDVRGADRSGISGTSVHHVNVVANESHHNGKAGIFFGRSDDLLIRGNETHHNAKDGATSGISVLMPQGDGAIVIRDNISHHNQMRDRGKPNTDGHGIILDDGKTTKSDDLPEYGGRFVVANNLVHHNGGAGILVYRTDRAVIDGNTAFHNNQDPTRSAKIGKGEIELRQSDHVAVRDNVAVADPDVDFAFAYSLRSPVGHRSVGLEWDGNFAWNENTGRAMTFASDGEQLPPRAGNFFGVDPMLDDDFGFHARSPADWHGAGWHDL